MTALKPKRIDLYQSFFEKAPISRKQERRYAAFFLPVALAIAIAGCYGFLMLEIAHIDKQIYPIETYLNTIDTQTLHQRADILLRDDDALSALAATMQQTAAAVDSYPHLEQTMLESVYSQAGELITVVSLEYDGVTGILCVSIETDRPESGQAYLERLRKTGNFSAIEHTGYAGETLGIPVYKVQIFAALPSPREIIGEE